MATITKDGLRHLDALGRGFDLLPYFSRVGQTLTESERALAESYAPALGLPVQRARGVGGWTDTGQLIAKGGIDPSWAEKEKAERTRLLAALKQVHGDELVKAILEDVTQTARGELEGRAAIMANQAGVLDGTIMKQAGRAGAIAVAAGGLALAADEPEHAFVLRLKLYQVGRWPIGPYGGYYRVF